MTILSSYLPQIDLHGLDRDYARILVNEFIEDNYKLHNKTVLIIHGNGTGILRKTVQETLKHNKYVEIYKIDNFNAGETIVQIKQKNWQKLSHMVVYKSKRIGGVYACIRNNMKIEDSLLEIFY